MGTLTQFMKDDVTHMGLVFIRICTVGNESSVPGTLCVLNPV